MLKHSLRIADLIEIAKQTLVEVAAQELKAKGEEVSLSRINVMTGIHRAEVARIYNTGKIRGLRENVISKVISTWQHDRRFASANGNPKVLKLEGMDSAFIKLIQSVSIDLNPYTVLFELERTETVKRTAKGLKLRKRIYLTKDREEGFRFLSEDTQDLMSAVEENLDNLHELPNLHIKTEFDNIPESALPKIRRWLLHKGSAFHKNVSTYLSRFDRDSAAKKETGRATRVAIGSFSIASPVTDRGSPANLSKPKLINSNKTEEGND